MANTTSTVQAIGEIKFEGNLVPQSWSHWLKIFNGGKTSGVIPIASLVLADIVYWYRPAKVDDEKSGLVKGYKAKFAADKLQRSYNAIAEQQAITKTQAKNAVKMLEDAGAITVEFRTINVRGTKLSNVMFLEPVPEVIALWQQYPYKTKTEKDKVQILYGELDQGLVDEYLSLCVKLPIPMRQKTHRSEQINKQVFVELQTGVSNIAQTNTENTTETSSEITSKTSPEISIYIKASGNAGSGKKENFEVGITSNRSKTNGAASPRSNPDSCGDGENDYHSQNKGLYDQVWNPNTEAFRVDSRGWAVLPPTPKFKLANFMATRGMQLEVLNIMDSDFTAEWNEAESQLYITTTYGDAGLEDDILGTVASVGTNWVEYEDDDICQPGNNSLRLLRDWGYKEGEFDQDWFNTRLKELWDEAVAFCAEHGKNAKALFKSRPAWCSLSINIDFDDEES